MFLYDCCVIKLRGVLLVGESVSAVSSSLGSLAPCCPARQGAVSAVSCTPRSLTTRCQNLPTFLEFNQEHKKHEKVSVKIFDKEERCHDLIHEIIKH